MMGETQDRQLEERQRIEQELKDEVEDLDVGDGAEEIVGGASAIDPSCGPMES